MKVLDLLQRVYYRARRDIACRQFGPTKRRLLFVLGHMRSGSSLLVHILNSNPEILGYGETHLKYHNRRSFLDLDREILHRFNEHNISTSKRRYAMDKVLHGHFVNASVLHHPAVRALMLIRSPEEALPSIVRVTGKNTPERAARYYLAQLKRLESWATHLEGRVLFFRYKDLIEYSEEVLLQITQFLELRTPLISTYNTMWSTGKPGIGDSSGTIKTGRIVRKREPVKEHIPDALMRESRHGYDQCTKALSDLCTHVKSSSVLDGLSETPAS